MKYTIEDLKYGRCAVINDGTLYELQEVLELVFPNDKYITNGSFKYYAIHPNRKEEWCPFDKTDLPTQSVKDFLTEEFVLPERWCVKDTHQEINDWFNKYGHTKVNNYQNLNMGYLHYPEINGRTVFTKHFSTNIQNGYTEISFDNFKKYVLKQENMDSRFPFKLTEKQGKRIIGVACDTWKRDLLDTWAKDFVAKEYTLVSEEFYKKMRKACTETQNKLFDEIFGEDEPEFKAGDWIYVTNPKDTPGCTLEEGDVVKIDQLLSNFVRTEKNPGKGGDIRFNGFRKATSEEIEQAQCLYKRGELILVKNIFDEWIVRYATGTAYEGKVGVYTSQKKEGTITFYSRHVSTNGLKLPD
jgi:hypothetical protein